MPAPIVSSVKIRNWLKSERPPKKDDVIYLSRHDALRDQNAMTIVVVALNGIRVKGQPYGSIFLPDERRVYIVTAREIEEGEGLDPRRVHQSLEHYPQSVRESERSGRYRRGLPPDKRDKVLD